MIIREEIILKRLINWTRIFVSIIAIGVLIFFLFRNQMFYVFNVLRYDNPVIFNGLTIHYKKGLSYQKIDSVIMFRDQINTNFIISLDTKKDLPKSSDDLELFIDYTKKVYKIDSIPNIGFKKNHKIYQTKSVVSGNVIAVFWYPDQNFFAEYSGSHKDYDIFTSMIDNLKFENR